MAIDSANVNTDDIPNVTCIGFSVLLIIEVLYKFTSRLLILLLPINPPFMVHIRLSSFAKLSADTIVLTNITVYIASLYITTRFTAKFCVSIVC